MNVLLFLLVGLAAGYIAEKLSRTSMGLLANFIVGVAGALVGGFLLGLAARGLFGTLMSATVGALVLLLLVGFFQRTT